MEMERRALEVLELRIERQDESPPVIEGHAAVFNQWSQELGGMFPFKERVQVGAFKESIETDDIRALFNHDPSKILGRNKAKTLELKETQKGLLVRIYPPDTVWARDLLVSIDRGDISQMSFGFVVLEDKWSQDADMSFRELLKVRLYDVSTVTFPAYPQTDVGVRAAMESYQRHADEIKRAKKLCWMELEKQKLDLLKEEF